VIHKNEVLKIVDHLLGSHTYNFDYSFYENWVEIEILVRKIIGEVNKSIETRYIKLMNCFMKACLNHMKPTIYRIKNNIFFPDLILDEIMSSDEKLLRVVRESLTEIENYINCEITDVEAALFTVHFRLAVDRAEEKANENKLRVLIGMQYRLCDFQPFVPTVIRII
jgi:mannitol operon transcriptional antiterminator